jgi:hypothetical protein
MGMAQIIRILGRFSDNLPNNNPYKELAYSRYRRLSSVVNWTV